MRNHNTLGDNPQDPASFGDPDVRQALRQALRLRYQNLPHLYSKILQATVNGTVPVSNGGLKVYWPLFVGRGRSKDRSVRRQLSVGL